MLWINQMTFHVCFSLKCDEPSVSGGISCNCIMLFGPHRNGSSELICKLTVIFYLLPI
jgi:hypothetical protein